MDVARTNGANTNFSLRWNAAENKIVEYSKNNKADPSWNETRTAS